MNELTLGLTTAIADLFDVHDGTVDITIPESQFGDFATNIALKLSKRLQANPQDIAAKIKDSLQAQNFEWLADISIAAPGFLNFKLTDTALWNQALASPIKSLEGTKVVLEYSCPNAFKELHVGHLYNTLIGDALGNLLERAGATVTRTNFGGDVGLHVAKTMWGAHDLLGSFDFSKLDSMPAKEHSIFLSKAYVCGAKAYEENEQSKSQIEDFNKQVYALHTSGDTESDFAKIYWLCRTWSYDYFKDFYKAIEVVNFDRFYPESETAPIGLEIVRNSNGVFQESDGAVVFKGEDIGLHTRVFITRENLPTYETKDIGVIKLELDEYGFDRRILITGNDQAEYMKIIFAAAERVIPDTTNKMLHLTNGMVRFGDGKKMSSRLGNVNRAVDVIEGARSAVEATEDKLRVTLSLGAVKYSFLKQRVGGDIAFDLDESVSLHGNSGPYLQYAYVRANSILQKAEASEVKPEFIESEREFVQKLSQFENVMANAVRELAQQLICTYLYELAQSFNRFYEHNRVIGDEREQLRLMLIKRYAQILQEGLQVLGIRVPEKM